jgi:hypothetical protein
MALFQKWLRKLTSILNQFLLTIISTLKNRMQYPATLLPQTHFKYIDSDLTAHHICRTAPEKDFINPVTEKIKDEALFQKPTDFFDYSTNHLGQFEIEFNYLSIVGEERKYFRTYWDYISAVKEPIHERDFIVDNSKGIFFFKIGDIHNQIQFPISNAKNKPDQLTAIVRHTPSNSNYWHFSIRWVDQNGAEISPNDAKWKNSITATIRARLQEIFIIPTPSPILIPEADYIK